MRFGSSTRLFLRKAGVLVGSQGYINFIDSSNITWTLTLDGPNDEIEVTASATGLATTPVTAASVTYAGATNLSADDVEEALDELDTEKAAIRSAACWLGKSGFYYAPPGATTASHAEADLFAIPVFIGRSFTIDRLAMEVVTTAGTAGAVLRMGIYNDDGTGFPGTLLLDAGTADATSTGTKTITVSQAVTPGLYWLAAAIQGAAATRPTTRATNTPPFLGMVMSAPGNSNGMGWLATGITGALPTPFPVGATVSGGNPHRVYARAA